MRTRLSYVLMIILPWMLGSCIPDPLPVDDIPKAETKMVVSSQIVPGVGLIVMVTKSVGALEAGRNSDVELLIQQIVIDDATVTLHHGSQSETLTSLGNGLYGGVTAPLLENVSYELHVKNSLLGEVIAATTVPAAVRFASAEIAYYSPGVDTLLQVDYSLNDPAGKNFYMVNVQRFSQKQEIQSLLNPRIFTHLTDDIAFDGKFFEEDFRTLFQRYSKGDSIAVVMSNVSEDYYKFLKLRNDRFRFSEFASEPLNYSSNVKGGYGFFNLHTQDVRVFVLE